MVSKIEIIFTRKFGAKSVTDGNKRFLSASTKLISDFIELQEKTEFDQAYTRKVESLMLKALIAVDQQVNDK